MQKTAFTYKVRKLAALLLACAVLACVPALAAVLDAAHSVTLTVNFVHEGAAQAGVEFRLYKIADMNADGTLTPCGKFAGYSLPDMNGMDTEDMRNLAALLEGVIAADGIAPDATAVTDASGKAVFGADGTLRPGLYLVTGDAGDGCAPQTSLVVLPGSDDTGNWEYDVTANVKTGPDDEKEEIEVEKIWDDGDYDARPGQIRVVLIGDGQIKDSVTLDKTNGWKHVWTDEELDDAVNEWQVIERPVPDGYTQSVQWEGNKVTITNKRPPDDDDGGDEGGGENPKLPQTGLLWWPVPVLAVTGTALFAAGLLHRRKHED